MDRLQGSLALKALKAYREWRERCNAARRRELEEAKQRAKVRFAEWFNQEPPEPDELDWHPVFQVDELTLIFHQAPPGLPAREHFHLLLTCPDCGQRVESQEIRSLLDLGMVLDSREPGPHECKGDSQ